MGGTLRIVQASSLLLCLVQATLALPSAGQPDSIPDVKRPQTIPYRVGAHLLPPALLKRVEPEYPMTAISQGRESVVRLQIIINESGEVWHAEVLRGGGRLLNDAALKAVRQWRYAPTIVDGQPASVILEVNLNLALPKFGALQKYKCGSDPPRIEPIHVGGNVQESKLLYKQEPSYPPGIQGSGALVLRVTVNENGDVYRVDMLRGPSELEQAVVSAVCQWRYAPTYLNGEPVPVVAIVTMIFNLSR